MFKRSRWQIECQRERYGYLIPLEIIYFIMRMEASGRRRFDDFYQTDALTIFTGQMSDNYFKGGKIL
jgi:hypothetical protein